MATGHEGRQHRILLIKSHEGVAACREQLATHVQLNYVALDSIHTLELGLLLLECLYSMRELFLLIDEAGGEDLLSLIELVFLLLQAFFL